MPVLIGLCGFAQVGKDTAAAHLREKHGYGRVAFADALRDLARKVNPIVDADSLQPWRYTDAMAVLGYETAKREVPEVREVLKRLGSGAREVLGKDVWVEAALRGVSRYSVVSDVRFLNEAELIRQKARLMGGEALIVRINRPDHGPESDFEREVVQIKADTTVWNDGSIERFQRHLDVLMACVGKNSWKQEALAL